MLSLTRHRSEAVVLRLRPGVEVVVRILEVSRGRVRLGLSAPADVAILRSELLPPAHGYDPAHRPPFDPD